MALRAHGYDLNETYLQGIFPLLKVNESIVLDLLHPLDFAVRFEGFFELLLCAVLGEVPGIQHLDLKYINDM